MPEADPRPAAVSHPVMGRRLCGPGVLLVALGLAAASCAAGPASSTRHPSAPTTSSTSTTVTGPPSTTLPVTVPAPPPPVTAPDPDALVAFESAGSAVAVVGSPFSFTVAASCQGPSTMRAFGVPAGLAMVDHHDCTATLSGTPTPGAEGVDGLRFTLAAGAGQSATQRFALTVNSPPSLRVRRMLNARVGVPLGSVLTASGQPAPLLSVTTTLPGGVSVVNKGGGVATLEGSPGPGTGGVYPLTVVASNGVGPPASAGSVLIVAEPPRITGASDAALVASAPMVPITVAATGYPVPDIRARGLPPGIVLTTHNDGTATLAGTPTPAASGRTFRVTLGARSSAGSATTAIDLTVGS